jgi:hypothetical protein
VTGASIRAPARLDAARGTVASAQTRPDIARGACGHRFHGKAPASPGFVGIASRPDYFPAPSAPHQDGSGRCVPPIYAAPSARRGGLVCTRLSSRRDDNAHRPVPVARRMDVALTPIWYSCQSDCGQGSIPRRMTSRSSAETYNAHW